MSALEAFKAAYGSNTTAADPPPKTQEGERLTNMETESRDQGGYERRSATDAHTPDPREKDSK